MTQSCFRLASVLQPRLASILQPRASSARCITLARRSLHSSSANPRSSAGLDVLYDGECPLCMHEIGWLRKRNKARTGDAPIQFTDISLPSYDPVNHGGVSYEDGMKVMHVVAADGQIHSGVASFQIMYEAVGLGFLVKALQKPFVKRMADRAYDFWARLRLPMSGRPSLEVLLERRAAEDATCSIKDRRKDCR
jgi:predicted DCC family thiol-disulfide oxidoreductase YuxK